ncbi:initiation factor 2B [Thermotoga sp. SG1]|nr:initiation factor 2B [Thermotoga sp. SG1]
MKTEGSREVAERLITFIEDNFESLNMNEVVRDIHLFFREKPMAVLEKLAHFLKTSPSKKELSEFLRLLKKTLERTVEYASSFCRGKRIITLSNSKTLKQTFIKAKPVCVYVLESRPGSEGRILVESLRREGLRVELVEDLLAYRILRKVDLCLVGADYVDKAGNVLNKVGSTTLAILCREQKKPFLVVADPFKFGSRSLKETDLFEVIPSELITAIITDPEGGTAC